MKPATHTVDVQPEEHWEHTIDDSSTRAYKGWGEAFRYRDLLILFVRRDFVTLYKQTVLGPLWYIIQPLLTTLTFAVIFGGIAGISTDGLPKILFYLSGITFWTYFSETLLKISDTFYANQKLFGKVYFPRIILPVSISISNLFKLGIQLVIFLIIYVIYYVQSPSFGPTWHLALLPLLVLVEAVLGLSIGMIISSLTTKYRDLKFLIQFGIQLLMYASPIVYPLSTVSDRFKLIILANPMTGILEAVKYAFFGIGVFEWSYLLYSVCFTLVTFLLGMWIFKRVEKTFVDTI